MPIAHLNPGYHNYSEQIQTASLNPKLLSSQQYADPSSSVDPGILTDLVTIKSEAKQAWSKPDVCETTYQYQYTPKSLYERTRSAPTENERKNKPHPKPVFLTNRLHYVPGYHNADSTLGRDFYKIDATCGTPEQQYRSSIKTKYIGGISTPAVRQYADNGAEDITRWERALPPNDSWMASGSMRGGTSGFARSFDDALADAQRNGAHEIASHNRFLRLAGADERDKIQRALDAQKDCSKPVNMNIPHLSTGTVSSERMRDKANIQAHPKKPLYRYPRPRGDYLIHPVWPPSIYHHRIPGFHADPPRGLSAYEKHQRSRLDGVY